MGRYLLLVVLSVSIGSAVLTLGARGTLDATARDAAEGQEDVLAREIAAAGQSAALNAMIDGDGFRDPTATLGTAQDYEGGRFTIDYTPGTTAQEASIRVSGSYGGATHTIQSRYAYDPMDAPGPMWLDVPFATASVSSSAEVSGDKPVQFDRRKHDELNLDGFLPLDDLGTDLATALDRADGEVAIPEATDWTAVGGLLDHLNVSDADGLYTKARGAVDPAAGDRVLAGDQVVTTRVTFGSAAATDGIMIVEGDLTVAADGRVTGKGMLLVEGALRVAPADPMDPGSKPGELDWEGIVMVRSMEAVLPIELDGEVDVRGMIVVDHQAFPPGGHLDVSVYRATDGLSDAAPEGDLSGQRSPWSSYTHPLLGTPYPWHQHTHAFDITPSATPRGDHVYFLENGRGGRHESEVQLASLLSALGDEPVYLEIANGENHGYARYHLRVDGSDGTGGMLSGSVQGGFGAFARADAPLRTQVFPADDFHTFDLDVQSLRGLKEAFDSNRCSPTLSWPTCIGLDWERERAMAVRVHRASDQARLYEATLYWHMRQDEIDRHEAEEAAWLARIEAGEAFGTHVVLGDDVALDFAIGPVDALSSRLDFDGDRVRLVDTQTSHVTADENEGAPLASTAGPSTAVTVCLAGETTRIPSTEVTTYLAIGATTGACGASEGSGASEKVAICHVEGASPMDQEVPVGSLASHLGHGDTVGPCDDGMAEEEAGPTGPPAPPGFAWICNKPGRTGIWWDRLVVDGAVDGHVRHGCLAGTCASNGR